MTTKKTTTARQTQISPPGQTSAHHLLDALLHTMRCIAQYEDALCELTHAVRHNDGLSPETSEELRALLEKIPAHDFGLDFDAAQAALLESRSVSKSKPKLAGSRSSRKSTPAASKPGRKSSK